MLTTKEIGIFLVSVLILGFSVSFMQGTKVFLFSLLSIFLILLINITAKKVVAFNLDSEIEIKFWNVKRYGFKPGMQFSKPIPMGLILPVLFSILSQAYIKFMAILVFDVKAKVYRAAKRFDLWSFTEMTEWHIGLIASAGIVANLLAAFLGYLIGLPGEMNFVALNIIFAFVNMLPISDLDGNKIFFADLLLWSFLAIIVFIAFLGVIFII